MQWKYEMYMELLDFHEGWKVYENHNSNTFSRDWFGVVVVVVVVVVEVSVSEGGGLSHCCSSNDNLIASITYNDFITESAFKSAVHTSATTPTISSSRSMSSCRTAVKYS